MDLELGENRPSNGGTSEPPSPRTPQQPTRAQLYRAVTEAVVAAKNNNVPEVDIMAVVMGREYEKNEEHAALLTAVGDACEAARSGGVASSDVSFITTRAMGLDAACGAASYSGPGWSGSTKRKSGFGFGGC